MRFVRIEAVDSINTNPGCAKQNSLVTRTAIISKIYRWYKTRAFSNKPPRSPIDYDIMLRRNGMERTVINAWRNSITNRPATVLNELHHFRRNADAYPYHSTETKSSKTRSNVQAVYVQIRPQFSITSSHDSVQITKNIIGKHSELCKIMHWTFDTYMF